MVTGGASRCYLGLRNYQSAEPNRLSEPPGVSSVLANNQFHSSDVEITLSLSVPVSGNREHRKLSGVIVHALSVVTLPKDIVVIKIDHAQTVKDICLKLRITL